MMRDSSLQKTAGVIVLVILFAAMLLVALLAGPAHAGPAAPGAAEPSDQAQEMLLSSTSALTPQAHLPTFLSGYATPAYRMGYCATSRPIDTYPDIGDLRAGWYVNFRAAMNPPRPQGMEYVRTIRLHQLTTCLRDDGDYLRNRTTCPYVQPYTYTLSSPNTRAEIVTMAQANPGSLWLIGNEMDRYDWGGVNPYNSSMEGDAKTGHQDEMLPELYAQAYHEFYHLIKGADPTAQVSIGGIVQATPSRLEYLTKVWNEYITRYYAIIPVDVWNVHNFIFKEKCDDFGADIPPGCTGPTCTNHTSGDPCYGTLYPDENHNDMAIFDQQIRAFRQWMKDRGQKNKPLIVSEYGIVYFHAGMEDPALVQSFMQSTFDYFMNTKDCSLGYSADECRLVQRWAWYSLDDNGGDYNMYSYLINPTTQQLTPRGVYFADYARNHLGGP